MRTGVHDKEEFRAVELQNIRWRFSVNDFVVAKDPEEITWFAGKIISIKNTDKGFFFFISVVSLEINILLM